MIVQAPRRRYSADVRALAPADRGRSALAVRRRRGLGYSYYDLLAQAGMESCSPMDSACVSRNAQRQNVVEDYWINNGMTQPASTPVPTITVNTDPTMAANYAAAAGAALPSGNIAQTGGSITSGGQVYSDTSLEAAQGWATPYVKAPVPVTVQPPAPKPAVTPAGSTVVQSASVPASVAAGSSWLTSAGVSVPAAVSGWPWYVWAGGGLALFLLMKGGR
jgi:hypothetical protein